MISSVRRRKTPLLASIVAFHRVPMVLLIQNRRQKRLCDLLYRLIWLFQTDPRCLRGSRAVFSSPAKTYHRLRVSTRSFSATSTTASRTFSWRVSTGSHTVSNRESRRTVFRRIAHHADREWPAYRSTPLYDRTSRSGLESDIRVVSMVWFDHDAHTSVEQFACSLPLASFRFEFYDRYAGSTHYDMKFAENK